MNTFIFVFIGGGLGALLRFIINLSFNKYFTSSIPYGTLFSNLIGCFLIGFFMALFSNKIESPNLKLFFTTGMMGGLTTFSTFSFETISFLISNNYEKALIYSFLSLFLSLFFTFISFKYFTFIFSNN
jgi:CrcB protein